MNSKFADVIEIFVLLFKLILLIVLIITGAINFTLGIFNEDPWRMTVAIMFYLIANNSALFSVKEEEK